MTTLKDVAEKAGVSMKTVSRVVNGDASVRPETRARVQDCIDELGYVPASAAQAMRTQRSGVIGLMTDVVATTPYSVDIVRGVQHSLRAFGKTLIIANTEGDPVLESRYIDVFRSHRVEGAIFATMFHQEVDAPPLAGAPLVLANCYASHGEVRASVLPDDYAGGYEAAAHLLRLGHRRIAMITLNPRLKATQLRTQAFREAMRDHGVTCDDSLLCAGKTGDLDNERCTAYDVALELLNRQNAPTAIVCGNDELAVHVYCAARDANRRVPDDLSVIGYDDFRVVARSLHPALTTVALPYFEIGQRA
ncbi:MAG: LacI family DNA-binding transcriptional regulator, partial [Ectothiorhodospiraceae bacterium]